MNELTNSENNPILDIVNEIQSKLNESNNSQANNADLNNVNSVKTKDLSGLDISKMLELLNGTNKQSLNYSNTSNINNSSGLNLDLNTIMDFKNLLGSINQTDPRQELLTSLKPFLRQTRQKNIDTYITILGVMKAINIFSNKDRD